MHDSIKTLFTHGFASIFVKGLTALLTMLIFILSSHVFDVDGNKEFIFYFGLMQFLGVFLAFGQPQFFLKKFAQSSLTGIYPTKKLSIWICVLVLGVLAALAIDSTFFGSDATRELLRLAILLGCVMAILDIFTSAMRGKGHLLTSLLARDLVWRVFVIAYFCWVLLNSKSLNNTTLYYPLFISVVILLIYLFVKYRDLLSWKMSNTDKTDGETFGNDVKVLFSFWIYALFSLGLPNIHIIISTYLLTGIESGAFVAIQKLSFVAFLPMIGMNLVISPLIARSFAEGSVVKIEKISKYSCWICFAVSSLTFLFFLAYGLHVLKIFGHDYGFARTSLLLLLGGFVLASALGPTNEFMMMANMEKELVRIMLLSNAIGIAFFVLMGSKYGVFGMCLSIVVLQNVIKLFMKNLIYKRHHVKIGLI